MRIKTLKKKNKNTRIIVASIAIVVAFALVMSTFVTINDAEATSFKMKDTDCREGWVKLPNNLNPQLGDCMANTLKAN
jgi:hypothetical protein